MSHTQKRAEKIEQVIKIIKKNPDMKELPVTLSIMFGCSTEKAREYIKVAQLMWLREKK